MEWTEDKKQTAIELVLDCIASGQSLKSIIDERSRSEVPCYATWMRWMREDDELLNNYAHACEERAEKIFEEILEIADDTSRDTIIGENGESQNTEWINRSKLRVDTRKWYLSKVNPKKFGDKTILEGGDKPITISFED